MTNREKINRMDNAELLFYIRTNNKCDSCIYKKEIIDNTCFNSIHCPEGIKKWLESECDENEQKISRDKKLKLGKLVIMTNADKIKQEICSYDNEKLAEIIENSGLNNRCKCCVYHRSSPDCMRNGCIQGVIKWLEKRLVEKKLPIMANQNNNANTLDYFNYIVSKLDERAILEALAEESSEVVKAALKLIRAKELSGNTTPKTKEEALHDLAEELTDLDMVRAVLEKKDGELLSAIAGIDKDGIEANPKWKRWAKRLGYED